MTMIINPWQSDHRLPSHPALQLSLGMARLEMSGLEGGRRCGCNFGWDLIYNARRAGRTPKFRPLLGFEKCKGQVAEASTPPQEIRGESTNHGQEESQSYQGGIHFEVPRARTTLSSQLLQAP